MNSTFLLHALPSVLKFEGGYSDNPNDSGGPTNYGITQAEYDRHRISCGESTQSVQLIKQDEVDNIYLTYWNAVHGDQLPYPIDWITFDAAVNMGPQTAINFLEQAVGLPKGYAISQNLINAVSAACTSLDGVHKLKESELQDRIQYYKDIVNNNPRDAVFLAGWINRVNILDNES